MEDMNNKSNTKRDNIVFSDDHYTLGKKDGDIYVIADGKRYTLSCHPYEPCLYITDENGFMSAIHNAFDPESVLYCFRRGETITSITGFEYDAKDFCRMVDYASDLVNAGIDDAERVFGGRAKSKKPQAEKAKKENDQSVQKEMKRIVLEHIVKDDPFYDLISNYPDSVVDYCIVNNVDRDFGYTGHWMALVRACNKLFVEDDGETIWHFDVGKAEAKRIEASELFARDDNNGKLNYRKAFLRPPYENNYTNDDFEKVNNTLFPNGRECLEVYEWSTDWSEYFDEGHEWWGALCYSVYDKSSDRYVIILASATD